MNANNIIVGDRVLVQSAPETKEHARIKGINKDNGLIIVKLSNGDITEMCPQFILKSFR